MLAPVHPTHFPLSPVPSLPHFPLPLHPLSPRSLSFLASDEHFYFLLAVARRSVTRNCATTKSSGKLSTTSSNTILSLNPLSTPCCAALARLKAFALAARSLVLVALLCKPLSQTMYPHFLLPLPSPPTLPEQCLPCFG
jgi:hypothetical protein